MVAIHFMPGRGQMRFSVQSGKFWQRTGCQRGTSTFIVSVFRTSGHACASGVAVRWIEQWCRISHSAGLGAPGFVLRDVKISKYAWLLLSGFDTGSALMTMAYGIFFFPRAGCTLAAFAVVGLKLQQGQVGYVCAVHRT